MSEFNHKVNVNEENNRIDKLLTELEADVSRAQIQTWIKDGLVTVNGDRVKPNYRLEVDDAIQWQKPEEEIIIIEPEPIPLDIIYEDDNLLIVNKEKGIVNDKAKEQQKHNNKS